MQTNIAPSQSDSVPPIAVAAAEIDRNGDDDDSGRPLVEAILKSKIYQDYERSFTDTTGLPMTLTSVDTWQLPHHGRRGENRFCALIAQKSRSCVACLKTHEHLCRRSMNGAQTMVCPVGLCDTAVPVRIGNNLIGFLHTGQVFRRKPMEAQFKHAMGLAEKWEMAGGRDKLRKIYFSSKIVPPRQYDSVVKLLTIFSQHLSMLGNQFFMHQKNAEPPAIAKARKFIHEHYSEDIKLGRIAEIVDASPFYFCKMFKKTMGIHFTEYVSRVRMERAKNLLLNPNLRISEIAFEVGFRSLTHFNRMFKKILGQSPTAYRMQLVEY